MKTCATKIEETLLDWMKSRESPTTAEEAKCFATAAVEGLALITLELETLKLTPCAKPESPQRCLSPRLHFE